MPEASEKRVCLETPGLVSADRTIRARQSRTARTSGMRPSGQSMEVHFPRIEPSPGAAVVDADTNQTAAWLFTARSTNSARGNVVPGDVLKRQVDGNAPDELDAALNNGDSIDFDIASTDWAPLDTWSGYCWYDANTCGPTGWIESEYKVVRNGTYVLEIGVVGSGVRRGARQA